MEEEEGVRRRPRWNDFVDDDDIVTVDCAHR